VRLPVGWRGHQHDAPLPRVRSRNAGDQLDKPRLPAAAVGVMRLIRSPTRRSPCPARLLSGCCLIGMLQPEQRARQRNLGLTDRDDLISSPRNSLTRGRACRRGPRQQRAVPADRRLGRVIVHGIWWRRSPRARRTSSRNSATAASPRCWCSSGVMSGTAPNRPRRGFFAVTMVRSATGTLDSKEHGLSEVENPADSAAFGSGCSASSGGGAGARRISVVIRGPVSGTAFRFRGGRL
jgi:hypothetical protein